MLTKQKLQFSDHQQKKSYKNLNLRLSRQKIEPKRCTKYLGVIIDEHLSFNEFMSTLKQKRNRANGILAKPRCYVTAAG